MVCKNKGVLNNCLINSKKIKENVITLKDVEISEKTYNLEISYLEICLFFLTKQHYS